MRSSNNVLSHFCLVLHFCSFARLHFCSSARLLCLIVPTVIRNVPGTGLYFTILASLRPVDNSPVSNALAGGASRIMAGLVMMPFTVLKVQMEVIIIVS